MIDADQKKYRLSLLALFIFLPPFFG